MFDLSTLFSSFLFFILPTKEEKVHFDCLRILIALELLFSPYLLSQNNNIKKKKEFSYLPKKYWADKIEYKIFFSFFFFIFIVCTTTHIFNFFSLLSVGKWKKNKTKEDIAVKIQIKKNKSLDPLRELYSVVTRNLFFI